MIVCPVCSHKNPEGSKLCESCGGSLEHFEYRACSSCGALNPAQNVFCNRCLSELLPSDQEGMAPSDKDIAVAPYEPPIVSPEEYISMKEAFIAQERPPQPSQEDRTQGADVEAEAIEEADLAEDLEAEPAIESPTEPEMEAGEESQVISQEIGDEDTDIDKDKAEQGDLAKAESAPSTDEPVTVPEVEETEPDLSSRVSLPLVSVNPLEGLEELIPLVAAVSMPRRATPPSPPGLSEDERHDAELFREIADEPAPLHEPAQIVVPPKVKSLSRTGRLALYLLVLLAALTPLFSGGQTVLSVQPRPSVASLAQTIEDLPTGSTVLISFDYGPAYAGEMNPLALAVVRHLAARSVRIVAMSTKPEGIGVAEQVLHTFANEPQTYDYGEHCVLLGYLPGQEAGLRTLNHALGDAFKVDHVQQRPLSELPITRGLDTLRDFDQVIILADDSPSIRHWIEQVHSRSNVPLHALVSAKIEPMLVPYWQSGQLRSLIAGAYGAIEYEASSGVQPHALLSSDAFAALFVALLLIAVITNVVRQEQPNKERGR